MREDPWGPSGGKQALIRHFVRLELHELPWKQIGILELIEGRAGAIIADRMSKGLRSDVDTR